MCAAAGAQVRDRVRDRVRVKARFRVRVRDRVYTVTVAQTSQYEVCSVIAGMYLRLWQR